MKSPKLNLDGSCPDCAHGWQCKFHQAQGVAKFKAQSEMLARVAVAIRHAAIDRTCGRFELESDEFLTAEAKAIALL